MDGSNHSLDQSGHNSQLFSRLTNSRVELDEIAVNFAAERVPSSALFWPAPSVETRARANTRRVCGLSTD